MHRREQTTYLQLINKKKKKKKNDYEVLFILDQHTELDFIQPFEDFFFNEKRETFSEPLL
jgi:predicted alpha/beta superfamily hydrolase